MRPAPTARDMRAHSLRPVRGLLAAGVVACVLAPVSARTDIPWVKSSPGGGGAFLTVDVSVTGKVLVGSDLSGAYLRTGTGSWTRIGKYDGLNRTYVGCVRWSPATGDT